jgi:hypothetical protein
MARPEVTGQKIAETLERDAYTIAQFCARHGISRSTYYVLKKNDEQPDETYILDRIIITKESAAAWRRKRAAKSKQQRLEREQIPSMSASEP